MSAQKELDEYYDQINEFGDWLRRKHKGCLYSAAKEVGFPLDENAILNLWLSPSAKKTQEMIVDDLPF